MNQTITTVKPKRLSIISIDVVDGLVYARYALTENYSLRYTPMSCKTNSKTEKIEDVNWIKEGF